MLNADQPLVTLISFDWELSQKPRQRRYWLMGNALGVFPSQSPKVGWRELHHVLRGKP
jgi:hypothetical protein